MKSKTNTSFFAKSKPFLPFLLFLIICLFLFISNAFPSLTGDEYGSLVEAKHLLKNPQALGYFVQLNLWSQISNLDWFLRLLSVIWLCIGLFWFNRWLHFENLDQKTINYATMLAALNPFLLFYGFQIRFYSIFFAASILFVWRFRAITKVINKKNTLLLVVSLLLLLTSHLFGWLVVLSMILFEILRRAGKRKWLVVGAFFLLSLTVLLTPLRAVLIELVMRLTNAHIITTTSRGLSLSMFAKIPMTLFFFIFGERIYPLWLWLTIPSILLTTIAFLYGLWELRYNTELLTLSILFLLNIPFLFLVLDPIAPPGLQGAGPRYVIYTIPFLILIITKGIKSKWMYWGMMIFAFIGIWFLAFPKWSYGQGDLMNWPKELNATINNPQGTCVVVDGRSKDSLLRYAPAGTTISQDINGCSGFQKILFVTFDFRLNMIRYFDQFESQLQNTYALQTNMTLFPAQISVFESSLNGNINKILPSRLDLPEQDLIFPIRIPNREWQIDGFVRLDQETPSTEILVDQLKGDLWLLSNYRLTTNIPLGTPVFSVLFTHLDGTQESTVIESGIETSSWSDSCTACTPIYHWKKLIHMVGTGYGYDDAYDTYLSTIWGMKYKPGLDNINKIKITYLLKSGTGYFFGVFPDSN